MATHLDVSGVLLLYHNQFEARASTVQEHVDAFPRHSQFKVWSVNTAPGFTAGLADCRFQAIVLHYSLFSPVGYNLDARFLEYLDRSDASYKIAFFQDEHHFCHQRFAFLNRFRVDCVYTLLEPASFSEVYQRHTSVRELVYHIPGYVSDELVAQARQHTKPDRERHIDVGYRGRKLAPYMGRGALEKYDIAVGFRRHARGSGLKLDIEADEHRRIYGDRWFRFLADCRAVLGVEAGVSIFDLDDAVRLAYERLHATRPNPSYEDLPAALLRRWEGNIPYRTISPRHFEAAALRTSQILFEGSYSGIMQPMVHYIPLRKDFANIDDVLRAFKDEAFRRELTENAHRDLIASGDYSYATFMRRFDQTLTAAGLTPAITPRQVAAVDRLLERDRFQRGLRTRFLVARYLPFPGRRFVRPLVRPILARFESSTKTWRLHTTPQDGHPQGTAQPGTSEGG